MKKCKLKEIPKFPILVSILIIILGISIWLLLIPEKEQSSDVNNQDKNTEEKKVDKEKRMSLAMVGDCLIHGAIYIEARTGNNTYDFSGMIEEVRPLIEKYDLKYYNQETIIGGKNLGLSHYPRFNSPDEIGDNMVSLGFNMVSLANNHSLDKGETAILYSNNYWKNKNVITAGTYSSKEDRDEIKIYEQNGIKYAFLAYTTATNGLPLPKGKEYLVNVYSDIKAKEDIEKVKDKVDVIIVSMHWGEEYVFEPTNRQKEIAKYLSSLGVNLIIGSHPHVIQPVDYVDKTLVVYSLGNFIAAQRPLGIDKMIGLMVGLDIVVKDNEVTFENINKSLLYTYATPQATKFKVYPFSSLNDNILNGYKQLETKYMEIVNKEVNYD